MENHLTRKETPQLGPYWNLQRTAYKVHMEWKSELSLFTKDKCHSWVRISHGLNILVTNLNNNNKENDNNEQETSEMQFEFFVENKCTCFCEPIKGSSKTTKTYSCLFIYKNCTYQCEKSWTDIYPEFFVYRSPSVTTTEFSSS